MQLCVLALVAYLTCTCIWFFGTDIFLMCYPPEAVFEIYIIIWKQVLKCYHDLLMFQFSVSLYVEMFKVELHVSYLNMPLDKVKSSVNIYTTNRQYISCTMIKLSCLHNLKVHKMTSTSNFRWHPQVKCMHMLKKYRNWQIESVFIYSCKALYHNPKYKHFLYVYGSGILGCDICITASYSHVWYHSIKIFLWLNPSY